MFQSKRPKSDHHYKNSKNMVLCRTNSACYVGSIMTYQVDIKLYKIIGLVTMWPVIMSQLWTKVKDYLKCLMKWHSLKGNYLNINNIHSIYTLRLLYWHIYRTDISTVLTYLPYWHIYRTDISTVLTYLLYWHIYHTGISTVLTYLPYWHIYCTDISTVLTYLLLSGKLQHLHYKFFNCFKMPR